MQGKKKGIVWRDETENQIQSHIQSETIQKFQSRSPSPPLERKFCCDHEGCDQKFSRLEHLNRHKRKHTGEKPFECPVPGCGKKFSRYDNMTQHLRSHESVRFKKEMKRIEKDAKESKGISFIDSTRLACISFESIVSEISASSSSTPSVSTSNLICSPDSETTCCPTSLETKKETIFSETLTQNQTKQEEVSSTSSSPTSSPLSLKDIKLHKLESSPYIQDSNQEFPSKKTRISEDNKEVTSRSCSESLREIVQEPSVLFLQKNTHGQFLTDCQILSLFKPFTSTPVSRNLLSH